MASRLKAKTARSADRHAENPLSVRLGPERARMEAYAARHGLTVHAAILKAVRELLDREDCHPASGTGEA